MTDDHNRKIISTCRGIEPAKNAVISTFDLDIPYIYFLHLSPFLFHTDSVFIESFAIIQHPLELLMIPSDKLAYLTDLSGSRGRTSGETALSAHSEEHEVF